MEEKKYYLAIDLGATSGRHIVAYKDEKGELVLDEVHRFLTGMSESPNGLIWEQDRLFNAIKEGIKKAFAKYEKIESLSIDTWGVDYVLMNGDSKLPPYYAYRNDRTYKRVDEVHSIMPFNEIYKRTGIQYAFFNTIYQLFDDLKTGRLDKATDFLFLPNFYSYLLTGKKSLEYTFASTTSLINAKTKKFDDEIISKLGFPKHLFKEISNPGTVLGYLKDDIAKEVGGNTKVVLCPSHDTASAFEAVDCPKDAVIISSGTWSLLGVKLDEPNTSLASMESNFTNEGGVNYIRYLKNIMGMWLINEVCRQKGLNVVEVCKQLDGINYQETFDVNDKSLDAPKVMADAICELLKHNPPKSDLELCYSIYHSLALSYKNTIDVIEKNLNKKFNSIYIVGGGAKNVFLNKLTEKITGKKVVALPIEATAIGNLKTQMKIN